MTEYRYDINVNSTDPERIYRGSLLNLRETGCDTSETWRWYWDGDQMIAFTVDTSWRGTATAVTAVTDSDETQRVVDGFRRVRAEGRDTDRYLALAAKVLGGERFVAVEVDRGYEVYALHYGDEDSARAWRDEIEAVFHGDVYRIEVESRLPGDEEWEREDDVCEEYYGEGQAEAGFVKEFPLDELPITMLVSSDG